MNETNWLILTLDSKLWISEDEKVKIKFHKYIGPETGTLNYSINGVLKETPIPGGLDSTDKSFKFFNASGTWYVKMNNDNTIDVLLPEIENAKFRQVDDTDL